MITRIAAAWDRFLAPQPYASMVVCRIALGSVLFFAYLGRLAHVPSIYGPQGVGGAALHDRLPGLAAGRALEAPWQWLHLTGSDAIVWLVYAALLLASLCFALGAWTRVAGLTALLLHTLLHARATTATGGWAVMIKPFLLWVALAPVGRFASFDARREPSLPAARWTGPGWPVRLLQMQIAAMYAVQWLRLEDPGWVAGGVLAVPLTDRWFGRFDVDWLAVGAPLRIFAWSALVLELFAPVLLWVRGLGRFWALGLIGLHLSLEALTNIGWWQPVMVAVLTVFLPVAWVAPLMDLPRRRARGDRL